MTYITKKRKLRSLSHLEEEDAIMQDEEAMLEEAGEVDGGAGSSAAATSRRHSPRRTRDKSDASATAETPAISNASKRRKGKKAASAASSSSSSGATAAAKNTSIAPTLEEGDEDDDIDADATPSTKMAPSKRPRTRSRGISLASAATSGNDSAGPTIAGPVVEVVDPASVVDGFDGVGGRDRLLSFADGSLLGGRDRLFSFGVGTDAGLIGAAGSHDHSGHNPHSDPVDSLVGTAVDALLGSRPRSMSQGSSSIGSLGLRSRSNTLDLMAGSGLLEGAGSDLLGLGGGGGRSRSNTLEFLSGVALGEGMGAASDGPDGHVHFDTNLSGKIRSGSHGSYSSHQSGVSNLSGSRKESVSSSQAQKRTSRASQRNKRRGDSSALDHLDALGDTKPAALSHAAAAAAAAASGGPGSDATRRHPGSGATAPTDGKTRKNSDHSQDSGHTLDSAHQRLLYEALISGGGASGIGSGGRQRSDTTESWAALVATSARERTDSWGGMSDISFGAAAGHADMVAEITASALHHDVTASSGHIDANDAAGGLALVQMATPPTSAQASLASGSTGPGTHIQRAGKKSSSSKTSVPKKIAVKSKKSTTGIGGAKIKSSSKMRRTDAASSAPVTHSLSVNFPKNMPHGAAAAAAKAAAEAATAAGASPAELSAIVAAAMATVSKQLFNIASDVEKAIASSKTGGKTPPGMKKVKIEYTARPTAKAKPSSVAAAKSGKLAANPAAKPAAKPAAQPAAPPVAKSGSTARPAPATGVSASSAPMHAKKVVDIPANSLASTASTNTSAVPSHKPQSSVARHPGAPASSNVSNSRSGGLSGSISAPSAKVTAQVATSSTVITKAHRHPTEKKRLPPRKRSNSGFGLFDTVMADLPAPLPDVPPVKKEPAPAIAAPTAATAAPAAPSATTASQISVDYDAVAAAVDAASSATLPGDLAKATTGAASIPPALLNHKIGPSGVPSTIVPSGHMKSPPSSMIASRVSQPALKTPAPQPPLKKRTKRPTPPDKTPLIHNRTPMVAGRPPLPSSSTSTASSAIASAIGNGTIHQNLTTPGAAPRRLVPTTPATGASTSTAASYSSAAAPGSAASYSASNTQSNQKWDEMFDCLVEYVKEQNKRHADTMRGGKPWKWDGNVPTTYKTKDGKALGRWINNQRSAKTKGSLKSEREERLLSTGLKWSVLSTNAWPDMLRELRRYVKEREDNGESWDGNVPTNYRIKAKGSDFDEDKNLGRWINRQRSLYQAGKLKKERQEELERIGLRWSVLSTTSWDVMYDALLDYAEDRRQENPESGWDGNVPANFKTDDTPPKSLGRWVNRQRSAYAKNKLKEEFVTRLEEAGLKWSVHERRDYS